jgi:aspartate racemase
VSAKSRGSIGIVGGAGPFAGLDLHAKILAETAASQDQDYPTIFVISQPELITDRTAYLQGKTSKNPATAIADQILRLEEMGATVAAIPCNTAHAPAIFERILALLREGGSRIQLLHMIMETRRHLQAHFPAISRVGVLSTTGTYSARIYPTMLIPAGYEVLVPEKATQEQSIHPAIYNPVYGLKANGYATDRARLALEDGILELIDKGAQAVIMGCTEIPLAFNRNKPVGTTLIDPTRVLARALIYKADSAKLKPKNSTQTETSSQK